MFLLLAVPHFATHKTPCLEIVLTVISAIVAAAPVASPTVIVCSNGACAGKLRTKGIYVLDPAKLKTAPAVSIVCFDKTGTLTQSVVGLSWPLCVLSVSGNVLVCSIMFPAYAVHVVRVSLRKRKRLSNTQCMNHCPESLHLVPEQCAPFKFSISMHWHRAPIASTKHSWFSD